MARAQAKTMSLCQLFLAQPRVMVGSAAGGEAYWKAFTSAQTGVGWQWVRRWAVGAGSHSALARRCLASQCQSNERAYEWY